MNSGRTRTSPAKILNEEVLKFPLNFKKIPMPLKNANPASSNKFIGSCFPGCGLTKSNIKSSHRHPISFDAVGKKPFSGKDFYESIGLHGKANQEYWNYNVHLYKVLIDTYDSIPRTSPKTVNAVLAARRMMHAMSTCGQQRWWCWKWLLNFFTTYDQLWLFFLSNISSVNLLQYPNENYGTPNWFIILSMLEANEKRQLPSELQTNFGWPSEHPEDTISAAQG